MMSDGTALHRLQQRGHAFKACKQRYGIELKMHEYLAACDAIYAFVHGSGSAEVHQFGHASANRYTVKIRNVQTIAGWCPATRQIKTFLPLSREGDPFRAP